MDARPSDAGRPLRLHFAPDTCSLASLIACFDAGLSVEVAPVSLVRGDQLGEAYAAINPARKVPALDIGGTVVTETPAILGYLAAIAPEAGLLPRDPLAKALVDACISYLCATLHVAHAHRMRGYRWVDGAEHEDAMRRKVPEAVGACYTHIERHVMRAPFVFGTTYTIADPYLFTIAQWMEADGVDPASVPRVAAHRELIRARPTVRRALAIEADLMAREAR